MVPHSTPKARLAGTGCVSRTTTSHPAVQADAAISSPIRPPPTTTMRVAVIIRARSSSASDRERSVRQRSPSGKRRGSVRGAAPVHSMTASPFMTPDGRWTSRVVGARATTGSPRRMSRPSASSAAFAISGGGEAPGRQHFLGERRTLKEGVVVLVEQEDRSLVAHFARALGGAEPRGVLAHDYDTGHFAGHGRTRSAFRSSYSRSTRSAWFARTARWLTYPLSVISAASMESGTVRRTARRSTCSTAESRRCRRKPGSDLGGHGNVPRLGRTLWYEYQADRVAVVSRDHEVTDGRPQPVQHHRP